VFEANDRSTYSNVAFSLLGLVLEKATGKPYSEIISSSILQPLGMNYTTMVKPKDSDGIIPWGPNDWRRDLDSDIPCVLSQS
jgi:CubicO group peptidase (beta-lactamase class C family)